MYNTQGLARYLKTSRSPHTKFIFWGRESPVQEGRGMDHPVFHDLFDFTMTYRRDSDIFAPYVMKIVPKKKRGKIAGLKM